MPTSIVNKLSNKRPLRPISWIPEATCWYSAGLGKSGIPNNHTSFGFSPVWKYI